MLHISDAVAPLIAQPAGDAEVALAAATAPLEASIAANTFDMAARAQATLITAEHHKVAAALVARGGTIDACTRSGLNSLDAMEAENEERLRGVVGVQL